VGRVSEQSRDALLVYDRRNHRDRPAFFAFAQPGLDALGVHPGSRLTFEQWRTTVQALRDHPLRRDELRVVEDTPDRVVVEVRGDGARRITCDRAREPHTVIEALPVNK